MFCPKCVSAHYLCALCLWRPEEDFGTPRAGVTGSCQPGMYVSYRCVYAGNWAQDFWRSSQCNRWAISPALKWFFERRKCQQYKRRKMKKIAEGHEQASHRTCRHDNEHRRVYLTHQLRNTEENNTTLSLLLKLTKIFLPFSLPPFFDSFFDSFFLSLFLSYLR